MLTSCAQQHARSRLAVLVFASVLADTMLRVIRAKIHTIHSHTLAFPFQAHPLHQRMEWERERVRVDGVYFCPYHPEHGVGEYRREHEDRKPGPGMLLRAAREHGLDLTQSVMVGDRCSDVAAANTAGLRQAFLMRGTETVPCPGEYMPVGSLAEVEWWIRESR